LTGADVVRYRDLEQDLERQLSQQSGPGALGQIDALARTLPRARVLDHALGALATRGQEVMRDRYPTADRR